MPVKHRGRRNQVASPTITVSHAIRRLPRLAYAGLGLALLHCTPDFESLSNGLDAGAGAAPHGGGTGGTPSDLPEGGSDVGVAGADPGVAGSAQGGSAQGGSAQGGSAPGGSTQGGDSPGGSTQGGDSPGGDSQGGSSGTDAGAGGVAGSEAGAGGGPPSECVWDPDVARYLGFDGGLKGVGFSSLVAVSGTTTTKAATATHAWDAVVGKTCAGSFKFAADFKGYASGVEPDEILYGDFRFDNANWTSAKALHGWARVSPLSAPIEGVQFFVMSGTSFLYRSVIDEQEFADGQWNELVIPLAAGANFDPTRVFRIGVEIVLNRAGTAGNPSVAPRVEVWLDDLWVEE